MSEPEQALPHSNAPRPSRLKEAVREARIEAAERTGVVVDLRDAELARLELLNDALDPVFEDVPPSVELFDRGISRGDQPRLWVDMIAHVAMGRDKRTYRFLQDSRFDRRILAESTEIPVIVDAVTRYIARRLVERDRQLSGDETGADSLTRYVSALQRGRRWRGFALFVLGALIGIVALLAAAWFLDPFTY